MSKCLSSLSVSPLLSSPLSLSLSKINPLPPFHTRLPQIVIKMYKLLFSSHAAGGSSFHLLFFSCSHVRDAVVSDPHRVRIVLDRLAISTSHHNGLRVSSATYERVGGVETSKRLSDHSIE
mmetsp:Transcript_7113/g.16218  ORF Transcript_7113/g.16218 Transcript_7113/m.16218 type:complete len:121 (-) Transcript_7113:47-409(-)